MTRLSSKELAVFGMLGAVMYASKLIMEALPNVHLLGALIIAITVVYRKKALYPIYIFVILTGIFSGISVWWIAYLYIWTILWGAAMLLPQNIPPKLAPIVYMFLSAAHGVLFGILFAPTQALFFGLSFEGTIAWILAGLPWDFVHGVSNFFFGLLIVPIINVLKLCNK